MKLLILIFGFALFFNFFSCAATSVNNPKEPSIKIASFNLQVFGNTKAANLEVLDLLAKIIRRYDIVAVQEITDISDTAIITLTNAVNSNGAQYQYVISPRLGRTVSMEQYAVLYNTETVSAVPGQYTFDEGGVDTFEREPYIAKFQSGKFDFVLVVVHISPTDAAAEISFLPTVMADAISHFGESDVICLGDFNADGSFYTETSYTNVFPAANYGWLIGNTEDTTVGISSLTYDRIVTTKTLEEDYTGQSGVFRYDTSFSMGSVTAGDVSDRYPVWAEFYTDRDSD